MRIERFQADYWKTEGSGALANTSSEPPSTETAAQLGDAGKINEGSPGIDKPTNPKSNPGISPDDIEKMNKTAEAFNKKIQFKIHEVTNRIMVQIVNVETKEVMMELPPEKIVDMVAKIEEEMGLILDKRV